MQKRRELPNKLRATTLPVVSIRDIERMQKRKPVLTLHRSETALTWASFIVNSKYILCVLYKRCRD